MDQDFEDSLVRRTSRTVSACPYSITRPGRDITFFLLTRFLTVIHTSSSAKSCKRPRSDASFDLDVENIDPNSVSPSKKIKTSDGALDKPSIPSKFVLAKAQQPLKDAIGSRHETNRPSLPHARSGPSSLTASRALRGRRGGILSRRRVSSSPFTRIDPPSSSLSSNTPNGLPFSIDAALSASMPSRTPDHDAIDTTTLDAPMPHGWFFQIHEDTAEEELGNLVQFSTETLDISDDENRAREKDYRGKENIPPSELPISGNVDTTLLVLHTAVAPVLRKDMMTDDVRTPLGSLKASDFYPEGCDASSVVIVHDKVLDENGPSRFAFNSMAQFDGNPSPVESLTGNQDAWKELLAKVESEKSEVDGTVSLAHNKESFPNKEQAPAFDIWESESAQGQDQDSEYAKA